MSLVLLIDDEPQMGSLVGMCLEEDGDRVIQVGDLAGALVAARAERPGVVLLDLSLGEEDGLTIFPVLRSEPALAKVPILAFTVHDSRREEALARGLDGFVTKPFETAGLRSLLRSHLEG